MRLITINFLILVFSIFAYAESEEYNCRGLAGGVQEVKVALQLNSPAKVEMTGTMEFVSETMTEKTKDQLYPAEITLGARTFTGNFLSTDQNGQIVTDPFFFQIWPVGENGLLLAFAFGEEVHYGRQIRVTDLYYSRFEPQYFCEKIPAPIEPPLFQFTFRIEK